MEVGSVSPVSAGAPEIDLATRQAMIAETQVQYNPVIRQMAMEHQHMREMLQKLTLPDQNPADTPNNIRKNRERPGGSERGSPLERKQNEDREKDSWRPVGMPLPGASRNLLSNASQGVFLAMQEEQTMTQYDEFIEDSQNQEEEYTRASDSYRSTDPGEKIAKKVGEMADLTFAPVLSISTSLEANKAYSNGLSLHEWVHEVPDKKF